jgi:hypothetical protein
MRVFKRKFRSQLAARQRRRTLKKTASKIIKRRQMLFLINIDAAEQNLAD